MKLFISILIIGFIVIGSLLSLIAIYASPDKIAHFEEASYFWIGNSIAILGFILFLKKALSKKSDLFIIHKD